jgi:hypothetical protein
VTEADVGARRAMSRRLVEFADRPWVGSSDNDQVGRALSDGGDKSDRLAAARQYVTIQLCDAPIERMKLILEEIARTTKGDWVSRAVRGRLEKLEDVMAFKPGTSDDAESLRSAIVALGKKRMPPREAPLRTH